MKNVEPLSYGTTLAGEGEAPINAFDNEATVGQSRPEGPTE